MRLERLSLRHFTSLSHVDLDFRDLPPGLVALTGENGAGKSTVLESVIAALYRTFPSRAGDLKDYATGRDSMIDVQFTVEGVGLFRARVNVDGDRGTSDAVLEHQGGPVNDGKVTTFDAAVRQRFPSLAMLLASAVATQNKAGNFIGKKAKDRKDLFAELLGLQAYEAMSQTAKAVVGVVDHARDKEQAVCDELARQTAPDLQEEHDLTQARLQGEAFAVRLQREALQQQLRDLEADLATRQDAIARHAAAVDRVTLLQDECDRLTGEHVQVVAERTQAGRTLEADLKRLQEKATAAREAVRQKGLDTIADLDKRVASNKKLLAEAENIRAAVASLADLTAKEQAVRTALEAAQAEQQASIEARASRQQQLAGLEVVEHALVRAQTGVLLIERVPFGERCAEAGCQFLADAITAKQRIETYEHDLAPKPRLVETIARLSDTIAAHRESVVRLTGERSEMQQQRTAQEKLAQYADKLTVAETRLAELQSARESLIQSTKDRLAELAVEHTTATDERRALHEATCDALTGRETTLRRALAEKAQRFQHATAAVTATADAHADALQVQAHLRDARQAFDDTTSTLAAMASEEQALARARLAFSASLARRTVLQERLATLEDERQDWLQLQRALGRDGLPVLEMDAAGPRISQFTNDLLMACFGSRFSVELVTQQARADGKGMKESFELLVTDNERGAIREVGDLSGGEQVIVSEALMNAIALYVNQQHPVPIRTCWRDETTGALDPENTLRYIDMLRKVQALGGYHHIFFVSQNPDTSALADAQIQVGGGTARLVLPPYGEAA